MTDKCNAEYFNTGANMKTSEYTSTGISKVTHYRWLSKNSPGKLVYVHKTSLRVDQTYQRGLNDSKRLRIASDFNWAAFGVLLVARRSDGSMWVMDGQHRLAAAMSRSDIKDVPVVVFEFDGNVEDEATDFIVANKNRKPLTGLDIFKAQVVSGDSVAIIVNEMILSSGRTIGSASDGKSVACVGAIYKSMTTDRAAMKALWPLICELSHGERVDNRLVTGMFYLECRLEDDEGNEHSLLEPKNQEKLLEAGLKAVLNAIAEASAYYKKGGDAVFARGILNLVNRRRRNLLKIRGTNLE